MTKDEFARVADLLRHFEREGPDNPQQGERLIAEVFRVCGQDVVESGFVESDDGIDCYYRTTIAGKPQTVGVEVKAGRQLVDASAVMRALNLHTIGRFDRMMIVSRSGFTSEAQAQAESLGVGKLDLLDPVSLRNWIASENVSPPVQLSRTDLILTTAMRELALVIAEHPEELWNVEWRELEKILREAFDGIGYESKLTRPAKDGGFDLELTAWDNGKKQTYLVEVKHWTTDKPGKGAVKKLIGVTASKSATGGLLISSSGFTSTAYEGWAEYEKPERIRLGGGEKIVSLCKLYKRTNKPFWVPIDTPLETLFEGTRRLDGK
jgi:restriction system protein